MRVCWAQWVFIAMVVILGVTQMLTACGNKGPLFIPTEEQIAEMENQSAARSTQDELDRLDAQNEQDAKKTTTE